MLKSKQTYNLAGYFMFESSFSSKECTPCILLWFLLPYVGLTGYIPMWHPWAQRSHSYGNWSECFLIKVLPFKKDLDPHAWKLRSCPKPRFFFPKSIKSNSIKKITDTGLDLKRKQSINPLAPQPPFVWFLFNSLMSLTWKGWGKAYTALLNVPYQHKQDADCWR